jgi:hypothetical protein
MIPKIASAFLTVQLQRLAPRGHKPLQIKRQRPPFYLERLMLVGADQAASAFLTYDRFAFNSSPIAA